VTVKLADALAALDVERERHVAVASEQPIAQRAHELGIASGLDRAAAILSRLVVDEHRRQAELAAAGVELGDAA
jgi:hypothetical protein